MNVLKISAIAAKGCEGGSNNMENNTLNNLRDDEIKSDLNLFSSVNRTLGASSKSAAPKTYHLKSFELTRAGGGLSQFTSYNRTLDDFTKEE